MRLIILNFVLKRLDWVDILKNNYSRYKPIIQ